MPGLHGVCDWVMRPGQPARPKGRPEKMIDFKWANPFADKQIDNFISLCGAEKDVPDERVPPR